MRTRLALAINDIHAPVHDAAVLGAVLRCARELDVSDVHLVGDIVDCANISKFLHRNLIRTVVDHEDEVNLLGDLLRHVQDVLPDTKRYFHLGNHEDRRSKYIAGRAPAMMRSVDGYHEALQLGNDWTTLPYGTPATLGNLLVTHGNKVRVNTAKAMLEAYRAPVLFGHTHRGSCHFHTGHASTIGAWENFCLCTLNPEYILGPANWQQGFSLVYWNRHRFHVVQVPIIDGSFMVGGQLYTATSKDKKSVDGAIGVHPVEAKGDRVSRLRRQGRKEGN